MYPFLLAAVRQDRALREHLGGDYVYFSADAEITDLGGTLDQLPRALVDLNLQ